MSDDFSTEPLTVNGITVQPKWPWSKEYRAEVARQIRASGRSDVLPRDRERQYLEWYARRHGITPKEARKTLFPRRKE